VSGKKLAADRSQAGKLGGYKAEGLANNLAFQLPSLIAFYPIRFFLNPDT
jgi:hypothetical protein